MKKRTVVKTLPDFLYSPEFITCLYNRSWDFKLGDGDIYIWHCILRQIASPNVFSSVLRVTKSEYTERYILFLSKIKLVLFNYDIMFTKDLDKIFLEVEGISLPVNAIDAEFIKNLRSKYSVRTHVDFFGTCRYITSLNPYENS